MLPWKLFVYRHHLVLPFVTPRLLKMDQTFTSISSYLILFFLLVCNPTTTSSTYLENAPLHNEGACALVNCVEGTCLLSLSSILGFECQCFPGWKKLFPFPTCSVPNCTVEFGCGDVAPPPRNPLLPFFNISNPCNLVFCGDGTCIANGTSGHICRCNNGSTNMFNNTLLPCVKQCNLGADCRDVGLGGSSPPPPSPSTSDSPANGTPPPRSPTPPGTNGGVSASMRIPCALMVIFFILVALLS